jgi:hypothetical protein
VQQCADLFLFFSLVEAGLDSDWESRKMEFLLIFASESDSFAYGMVYRGFDDHLPPFGNVKRCSYVDHSVRELRNPRVNWLVRMLGPWSESSASHDNIPDLAGIALVTDKQLKTARCIKQWPEYEGTQQRTIPAGGTVEDGVYASEKMFTPALWMIAGW